MNDKPHEDWKKRVEDLNAAGEWRIGPPVITGEIFERDGQQFITSWDVCRSGYCATLPADSIVLINENTYEVLGYSYTRREYWICSI